VDDLSKLKCINLPLLSTAQTQPYTNAAYYRYKVALFSTQAIIITCRLSRSTEHAHTNVRNNTLLGQSGYYRSWYYTTMMAVTMRGTKKVMATAAATDRPAGESVG